MTPKFITLTRFALPNDSIMVNPRRVNCFLENRAPSAQPNLRGKLGTVVQYNHDDCFVVKESMDEIKQFREFLGPLADRYNDVQLGALRHEMHAMAELLLDIYLYKKAPHKTLSTTFDDFPAKP